MATGASWHIWLRGLRSSIHARIPLSATAVRTAPLPRIAVPSQTASPVWASSRNIRSLDGVRGLAILLVLWCHLDVFVRGPAQPNSVSAAVRDIASNAGTGVQLFFVLSGFLLFLPYARALVTPEHAAWPRAITFYQRRMRRILPAYLTIFLAIAGLMLSAQVQRQSLRLALAQYPWGQMLTGLLLLFDLHHSTFDLIAGVNPFLGRLDAPLWSLAVEWQFYLLLPVLAWGLSRLGTLRRVVVAVVLVMVYGLLMRGAAAWMHYHAGLVDPADAPGLLGVFLSLLYGVRGKFLEVFAPGILASLLYVWGIERENWTPAQRRRLAFLLMPVAGIGFVGASLWATFASGRYEGLEAFYWPSAQRHGMWAITYAIAGDWAFGLCAAALLVIVLCLPRSWGKVFSLRPLTFVGLISYSLYLWHWPIAYVDGYAHPQLPPIVAVGGIFAWSVVLYYVVERPFLHHRRRV